MHPVQSLRRTQMREAGARHEHMRGILMIDRSEHASFLQRANEVDPFAYPPIGDQLAQ